MNCVAARDRLAEHALGVLASRDAGAVERHLQWCAACRKEAAELQQASATLVFSVAPAEPPRDLGDRVVAVIGEAVGTRTPAGRRGGRIAVALVVAATLALSGLGWGAVMAGRASRFQDQANAARHQQELALVKFARLISTLPFSGSRDRIYLGQLSPPAGGVGGGTAMRLVSPTIIDMAFVNVTGLTSGPRDRLPFTVTLSGDGGRALTIGRITGLDTGGGATIYRQFNRDLSGYEHVVVRDVTGRLVLAGDVTSNVTLASTNP